MTDDDRLASARLRIEQLKTEVGAGRRYRDQLIIERDTARYQAAQLRESVDQAREHIAQSERTIQWWAAEYARTVERYDRRIVRLHQGYARRLAHGGDQTTMSQEDR